jgi:hypothetical protein
MNRPIEAIGTGAAIFSAAVGYVAIQNQVVFLWQVAALSTLGAFAILWFAVFGTPALKSVWRVRLRFGVNADLTSRVAALEGRLKRLDSESTLHLLMLSLLEFSGGATTVILLGDRMSPEQFVQRLRVALPTAHTIAEGLIKTDGGEQFQPMLSSGLDLLIVTGALKKIPFERIASLLLSELSISVARRIVSVSSIIDGYGMENATKWRSMVGDV